MDIGSLIVWLLIGLIAGGIASLIVPGRTPGGAIGALIVGILGGFLGGWILDLLDVGFGYTLLGSIVVATLGAVIILYVLRAAKT
ncbi:MAG: GlsB/YeaQ/YmgE family stress response membrane protein [Thermomicrobiales bacterium]